MQRVRSEWTGLPRPTALRWLLVLALVAAALAVPASAQALTRSQAKRIALHVLRPQAVRGAVRVLGLPHPLGPDSVVFEGGPGPTALGEQVITQGDTEWLATTASGQPIGQRAWVFWEDLQPGAAFQHPSRLLLISDRNGRTLRNVRLAWWPDIDASPAPFVERGSAPRYTLYSHWPTRAEDLAQSARSATRATTAPRLTQSCIITIGDRTDHIAGFDVDLANWRSLARGFGMPYFGAVNGADLPGQIRLARGRGCSEITLVIEGHGSAPPVPGYWSGPNVSRQPTVWLNWQKPQKIVSPSAKPSIRYQVVGEDLTADRVVKVLTQSGGGTRAPSFNVVVQSCFAGRWIQPLKGIAKVVVTSSAASEASHGDSACGGSDFTKVLIPGVDQAVRTGGSGTALQSALLTATAAARASLNQKRRRHPTWWIERPGLSVSGKLQGPGGGEQGPPPALPPSRIPHGTVTLTDTWSVHQPQPSGVERTLSATCTARLTYDGTQSVGVSETYSWTENVIQHRTDGTDSQSTTTRNGSFSGSGESDGAPLTFTRDPAGNAAYTFSLYTAQELMNVDQRIDSSPPPQTNDTSYRSSCWNEDPNRSTPTDLAGVASSTGHAAGSLDQETHNNNYVTHSTVSWTLDP